MGVGLTRYGNKVTYKYNGTTKPAYESETANGTLTYDHKNGFYYYDGKEINHITDLTTGTNGNVFAEVVSNIYAYGDSNLNAKASQMLFANDVRYWLATQVVSTGTGCVYYNLFHVDGYSKRMGCTNDLFSSAGTTNSYMAGVRAVVTLSSDITLTGSSEAGWSYTVD